MAKPAQPFFLTSESWGEIEIVKSGGGDRNLEILGVNTETGELTIKGALPGARGGLLVIITQEGEMNVEKPKEVAVEESKEEVKEEVVAEEPKEEVKKEDETKAEKEAQE